METRAARGPQPSAAQPGGMGHHQSRAALVTYAGPGRLPVRHAAPHAPRAPPDGTAPHPTCATARLLGRVEVRGASGRNARVVGCKHTRGCGPQAAVRGPTWRHQGLQRVDVWLGGWQSQRRRAGGGPGGARPPSTMSQSALLSDKDDSRKASWAATLVALDWRGRVAGRGGGGALAAQASALAQRRRRRRLWLCVQPELPARPTAPLLQPRLTHAMFSSRL